MTKDKIRLQAEAEALVAKLLLAESRVIILTTISKTLVTYSFIVRLMSAMLEFCNCFCDFDRNIDFS
jgi:hypothetical protein